jgi:hypothetical protein
MLIQLDAPDMEAKHAQCTVHTTAIKYPEPNRRDPTRLQSSGFEPDTGYRSNPCGRKTGNSDITIFGAN